MRGKTFTFRKIETGGILQVNALSEKAARKGMNLDPELWETVNPAAPTTPQVEGEQETDPEPG